MAYCMYVQDRIHERIHEELPAFERQLASSKSVQTRLLDLTSNVNKLSNSLLNPEVCHPCLEISEYLKWNKDRTAAESTLCTKSSFKLSAGIL